MSVCEVKPIKHFVLSEHTNNLYKKEAGSSIALARDVADKVNELIDSFNQLAKEKWEKIHEQDGTIRKAVLYMKDNLINSLSDLMDLLLKNGYVDKRIEEHIGVLIERIDNLAGAITEGSTTLDSELIDIRVGYDGTIYQNAGESVRNQVEGVYKTLNKIDLSSYIQDSFVRKSNGTIKASTGSNFRMSNPIEITTSKLYFKGDFKTFSDTNLINFYSSSVIEENSFIESIDPSIKGVMNEINIPEGATHFVVCTSNEMWNKTNIYLGGDTLEKTKDLILKPITLNVDLNGYFIRANGSKVESDGMVITKPIEITHNKLYLKGNNKNYSSTKLIHFYSNTEVSFYGYIGSYQPTNSTLQEINIPEGAKYFRVCTGTKQLPITQLYFGGELSNKPLKRIDEIMSTLILGTDHKKIKIIGDSIVNGLRGTGYDTNGELIYGSNYVNVGGYCWANELKSYLEDKYDCEVVNYGVSGIGSDVLLSKMSDLIKEDDDIIICAVGTNDRVVGKDAYTGQQRTLDSIYKNMNGIYTYAKRLGKEIIFISPIPSSLEDEEGRNFHTEDIENLYVKLGVEKGIEIIPMHKLLSDYCDLKGIEIDSLLNDGLHPNDTGYEVMFKIICKKLGFAPKRKGANW